MSFDTSTHQQKIIKFLSSIMSDKLCSPIKNYLNAYSDIYEIRLRINSPLAFTTSKGNLVTGIQCGRDDLQVILSRMSGGNFLRNEELMRCGYISLPYGIRVGVCGDAFISDGSVKILKQVNYINIRIPVSLICDCSFAIEHIVKKEFSSSILVFSPPGQGKTTLLRSISATLASDPYKKRVCVIDTASELKVEGVGVSSADYLCGYPKAYGINLATRYFNPEYLICDELGLAEECNEVLNAAHTGVPLIASVHADSYTSLLTKKHVSSLLDNNVFDTLIKIKRVNKLFEFEIKSVSEL